MTLSELRQKPHLSASSIGDYIECGLLYKFGRIDRLPMDFKSDALEFGTVIHLVLGEYYHGKLMEDELTLKDILQSFEEYWRSKAEDNDEIQYSKDNTFESLLLQGKELLTVWYNKKTEDNFKILGIEESFSFTIEGIEVPIIGAMDLIEEDEAGTIVITDFKTSSRAYSTDEVDQNEQLTVYKMAAKKNGFGDREILLKFDCLIKTLKPKFEPYWTTRSEVDEKRLAKKIHYVWEGIKKGVFIPNDQSWRHKNCPYRQTCDKWFMEEEK